jgi:hypothetical protein
LWLYKLLKFIIIWLGRQDSNLRMPVPKTGALPLGDAPAGVIAPVNPTGVANLPRRLAPVE